MAGNVWEWTASVFDENYGGGEQRVADAGSRRLPRAPRRRVEHRPGVPALGVPLPLDAGLPHRPDGFRLARIP